jgi:hypothetical protein
VYVVAVAPGTSAHAPAVPPEAGVRRCQWRDVIVGAGVPVNVPGVAVRTEPVAVAPAIFGATALRAWSRSNVVVPVLTGTQPDRRPP